MQGNRWGEVSVPVERVCGKNLVVASQGGEPAEQNIESRGKGSMLSSVKEEEVHITIR